MPTYDYSCEKCGLKFELRLKFSDEVDQPCVDVDCGSVAKRQFSAVPIVFKGSGWYVNDYGKKGSSSGKSGDSATSETGSTSSTEKKSADTSASKESSSSDKSAKDTNTSKTTSSSKSTD